MSNSDKNLFNLGMSEEAGTLFQAVKKHIEENVAVGIVSEEL